MSKQKRKSRASIGIGKQLFLNSFPFRAYSLTKEEIKKQIESRTNKCPRFKSYELEQTDYGYKVNIRCNKECQVCNPSILCKKSSRVTHESIPNAPSAPQNPTMKIPRNTKQDLKLYCRHHKIDSLGEGVADLLLFYELNKNPVPDEKITVSIQREES